LISRSCAVVAFGTGENPDPTGKWLRSVFRMKGSTSHAPNAATRPAKPGRPFSHSSTVTFGFGTLSLLSIRGSAAPDNISLYPGYENHRPLVTCARLCLDGSPKI
jgi:hypothetical protein